MTLLTSQIIIKCIITIGAVFGIYLLTCFTIKIWKSDIDTQKLFNVQSWFEEKIPTIPLRDKKFLYFKGEEIGEVNGFKINNDEKTIYFENIYFKTENSSVLQGKELEFQNWHIKLTNAEMLAMSAVIPGRPMGGLCTKCTFAILRERKI